MPTADESYEALQDADQKEQIGYARFLCERYLESHPDHGPTLIRYVRNLISLAQYSLAEEALDHAESKVPQKRLHLVLA